MKKEKEDCLYLNVFAPYVRYAKCRRAGSTYTSAGVLSKANTIYLFFVFLENSQVFLAFVALHHIGMASSQKFLTHFLFLGTRKQSYFCHVGVDTRWFILSRIWGYGHGRISYNEEYYIQRCHLSYHKLQTRTDR